MEIPIIEVPPEESPEPPDPPDPPSLNPESEDISLKPRELDPFCVHSPSSTGKSPAEFEKGEVVLVVHENPVLQPFNRLAKPVWPKTPATIPSSFFRDVNFKVIIMTVMISQTNTLNQITITLFHS